MYTFGRLLRRARAGSRRTVAGCRPPPVDADHDLEEILANNKRWVAATNAADPTFFPKLAEGQSPQFLYVGCSDSRLVPNDMLGLGLGNLFVHRNVANLVVASDLNFLSVLTYAVEHLDVKHVLVTGHYDCGGVRAAMKNRGLGARPRLFHLRPLKMKLNLMNSMRSHRWRRRGAAPPRRRRRGRRRVYPSRGQFCDCVVPLRSLTQSRK